MSWRYGSSMTMEPTGWCSWATSSTPMRAYHDHEWGMPSDDDRHLFEKICLEAFQCGLSWSTVLARRDRLRDVFANFDIEQLTLFTDSDIETLVLDPSIIRHRGKITAVLTNARACRQLIDETGSLAAYLWSFAPRGDHAPHGPNPPSTSDESVHLSKDLKKRGWVFVGATTMYALMQSIGMINDHDPSCPIRSVATRARADFAMPTLARN